MKYWISLLILLIAGCASTAEPVASTHQELGARPSEPILISSIDAAYQVHGLAGDGVLLFQVQPTTVAAKPKGVHVLLPFLGQIADLATPPSGWGTPLNVKLESSTRSGGVISGQLLVIDNQVPPALAGTAPALVYRYHYSFSVRQGFSSSLLETHALPLFTAFPLGSAPPDGVLYAGSIALLPGGQLAATDSIIGALWVSDVSLDHWFLALIDPTPPPGNKFSAAFGPPLSGIGRAQGGGTRSYDFLPPAPPGSPPGLGLYPGSKAITYAAITDEVCWSVVLPGGVYCAPRETLVAFADPTTKPFRQVMAAGLDSVGSLSSSCEYDRFHPGSEWLYFSPSIDTATVGFVNTVFRVSLVSGAVETVAASNEAFDFTSEISALPTPGEAERTALVAAMGQEYNNAEVNVLLGGVSTFVSPVVTPLVVVRQ